MSIHNEKKDNLNPMVEPINNTSGLMGGGSSHQL
jgi:hypothetical protein